MKRALGLVLFTVLAAAFTSGVAAQDAANAAPTVDTLRLQLLDAQAKEAELQARLQQLDEDLKPENIERSLAGVGSTRPEELRESRRRQLSIERDGVRAQLKLVTTSRERLESVIRTTETQAYQQSADGGAIPSGQMLSAQHAAGPRWLVGLLGGSIALVGIVLIIVFIRRP